MKKYIPLFVFLVCCVCILIPYVQQPISRCDEGIILFGADRILNGDVLYKDFWSLYPPGQFYAVATLFFLFGKKMIVARIYDAIIKLGICFLLFKSSKSLINSWFSALLSIVAMLVLTFDTYSIYPVFSALLLSLFLFYFNRNLNNSLWKNYASIFILMIISFIRIDIATYAGFVYFIQFLFNQYKINLKKNSLQVVLAILLFSVFAILIIHFNFGLENYYQDVIKAPSILATIFRKTDYPLSLKINTITLRFLIVPVFNIASLLISLFLVFVKKEKNYLLFLVLSLFSCLMLMQVSFRADNVHLMPATLVSLFLIPFWYKIDSENKIIKYAKNTLLVFYVSFFCLSPLKSLYVLRNENLTNRNKNHKIERAEHIYLEKELISMLQVVDSLTTKDEPIYVGVLNHDKFIVNSTGFYFLAKRKSATKYSEMAPGFIDTKEIQNEMKTELENNKPKILILENNYWFEPNPTQIDDNVNILDDYIYANYELFRNIGGMYIYKKK